MNSYDKWLQAPYARQDRYEVMIERFEEEVRDRWEEGDREWIDCWLDDNQIRDLLAVIWMAWRNRRPTAINDSVAINAEAYDTIDSALEQALKGAVNEYSEKNCPDSDDDDREGE